jgi:metallophosphoesterase superfamily enzyme
MGNHDILQADWYSEAGIELFREPLLIQQFAFVHDAEDLQEDDDKYYFSGHIHPGYYLKGSGRQHLQLPCYYFGKKHAVLPAFGKFTGTYPIQPKKGDAIYVLVNNQVMRMQ